MNFPIWGVPVVGGGFMIAMIAIVHVFVSHFAIGGGLYLVLTERKARRSGDAAMLEFVKQHTTFFVLLVLVFGAVTGVGIWWTIALVHPDATSLLIHVFMWVWAIEWVLFLVELLAAIVYRYGWDRLDARTHEQVGWIYVISAWLSLFMINGILSFMLTPGRWPDTHRLADGFFNPGMWPSLFTRTAVCVVLAGLYTSVSASLQKDEDLKERAVRWSAWWVLIGSLALPIGGIWLMASLPEQAREMVRGGSPLIAVFTVISVGLAALIAVLTVLGPMLSPRRFHPAFAFILVALAFASMGSTEWVREAARKPYVVHGVMYSNGFRMEQMSDLYTSGVLASAKWVRPEPSDATDLRRLGRKVFRLQCSSCHTVNGLNSISYHVKGWSKETIDTQTQFLGSLRGYMPPFVGTEDERAGLVEWLFGLSQREKSRLALAARSAEKGAR